MSTIKEGQYRGRITRQGFTVSKQGNQGFWLEFDILGEDTRRIVYMWFTDKTIDRYIEDFERLGYVPQSFTEIDPLREGHHSYVGVESDLYCKHEEWKGKTQEKWNLSNPNFGGPKPATEGAIAKLDGVFGRALKRKAGGKKNTAPAVAPSESMPLGAGQVPDEDVPF